MRISQKLALTRSCPKCGGKGTVLVPNGGAIRDRRMKLRLSLRVAAQRIGISHIYLTDVENGRRGVSKNNLQRILTVLEWKPNANV